MATHFCTLLKYFRSNITLLPTDISELPKCLINIEEEDVLIVFSYYRFNRVALNIAKWFRKKNAVVVLVTNSEANPYGKFCDLRLFFPATYSPFFKAVYSASFLFELILHLAYEKGDNEGNFAQLEELFVFSKRFLHQHTTLSTASRQESYPSRPQDKSGNLYRFHALELS